MRRGPSASLDDFVDACGARGICLMGTHSIGIAELSGFSFSGYWLVAKNEDMLSLRSSSARPSEFSV